MNYEVGSFSSFSHTNTNNVKAACPPNRLENEITYDSAFKNFFGRKEVLAIILREVVDEFRHKPLTFIKNSIITNDVYAIDDGTQYGDDRDFNGETLYNVAVHCETRETELDVDLFFDLGIQGDYKTSYEILNRAIYYTSKSLTRQSVVDSSYDELIPVRSTWICFNAIPEDSHNAIHPFRLKDFSCKDPIKGRFLMDINLLMLSKDYDWDVKDADIIKFLQAIFKNRLYDKDFNPDLEVTAAMEREVSAIKLEQEQEQHNVMTTFSEVLGREEGRLEGTIRTLLNLNYTDEQILDYLDENNGLTEVNASHYLNLVKNE